MTVSQGQVAYCDGDLRTDPAVARYTPRPPFYESLRRRRVLEQPSPAERKRAPP